MKALYLTYDGLTDQLGQSQIIPYLLGLARRGHSLHVISFEKSARFARDGERVARELRAEGITWEAKSYTKRPPVLSTVWDVQRMRRATVAAHRRHRFDLVHCRSYIAALVALHLRSTASVPFVFDMRGFWADEKAEVGAWPQGRLLYRHVYRFFKRREQDFLKAASGIVTLTRRGMHELEGWPVMQGAPIPRSVIPCSVNFTEFRPDEERRRDLRQRLGIPHDATVLCYVGSLGTWYMLPEMLDFFVRFRLRKPGAVFLLVTHDEPSDLPSLLAARALPEASVRVRSAARSEVAAFLAAADVGISFIQPLSSKVSSSPTKVGEYLAVGLPVVSNTGIGDLDEILDAVGGCAVIDEFSIRAYDAAIGRIEFARAPMAIREQARQFYDLELAIQRYHDLYASVARAR